jgi:hypothetical protein
LLHVLDDKLRGHTEKGGLFGDDDMCLLLLVYAIKIYISFLSIPLPYGRATFEALVREKDEPNERRMRRYSPLMHEENICYAPLVVNRSLFSNQRVTQSQRKPSVFSQLPYT